jgi:hypothetical protein
MRVRIRIDTVSDIGHFILAVADVKTPVYIEDNRNKRVDAKSFLGVAHATEFEELYCVCKEDIYNKIKYFVVEEDVNK